MWGHRVAFGKFQVEKLVPQHRVHRAQVTDNCLHPAGVLGVCVTSQRYKLKIFQEKFHKGLFWHIKREANKSLVWRSTRRDCTNIFYEVSFN